MKSLSESDAVSRVRTKIDELAAVSSDMLDIATDDRNLEAVIKNLIPDAIIDIHLSAPASLLEGISITPTAGTISAGMVDITFSPAAGQSFLRLVHLKASDSNITLTSYYDEDSSVARLQQNKYTRATSSCPVLIKKAGTTQSSPVFTYFGAGSSASFSASYIPYPVASNSAYSVSTRLYENVLDYLTGLVLLSFKYNEQARIFLEKAKAEFIQ